mmetsp:Transcript_24861/g.48579  ORF Transcript_24861/g.48579 Transcript_24861/m.48579 type:complete len:594 (+) Transcript_24861:26-1807(+)
MGSHKPQMRPETGAREHSTSSTPLLAFGTSNESYVLGEQKSEESEWLGEQKRVHEMFDFEKGGLNLSQAYMVYLQTSVHYDAVTFDMFAEFFDQSDLRAFDGTLSLDEFTALCHMITEKSKESLRDINTAINHLDPIWMLIYLLTYPVTIWFARPGSKSEKDTQLLKSLLANLGLAPAIRNKITEQWCYFLGFWILVFLWASMCWICTALELFAAYENPYRGVSFIEALLGPILTFAAIVYFTVTHLYVATSESALLPRWDIESKEDQEGPSSLFILSRAMHIPAKQKTLEFNSRRLRWLIALGTALCISISPFCYRLSSKKYNLFGSALNEDSFAVEATVQAAFALVLNTLTVGWFAYLFLGVFFVYWERFGFFKNLHGMIVEQSREGVSLPPWLPKIKVDSERNIMQWSRARQAIIGFNNEKIFEAEALIGIFMVFLLIISGFIITHKYFVHILQPKGRFMFYVLSGYIIAFSGPAMVYVLYVCLQINNIEDETRAKLKKESWILHERAVCAERKGNREDATRYSKAHETLSRYVVRICDPLVAFKFSFMSAAVDRNLLFAVGTSAAGSLAYYLSSVASSLEELGPIKPLV